MQGLACGSGEVDEQVGALGWGEGDLLCFNGSGEQALIAADLDEGLVIVRDRLKKRLLATLTDAEAVEARFDLEVGADFSVDEDAVGVELGDPGVFGIAGRWGSRAGRRW